MNLTLIIGKQHRTRQNLKIGRAGQTSIRYKNWMARSVGRTNDVFCQ